MATPKSIAIMIASKAKPQMMKEQRDGEAPQDGEGFFAELAADILKAVKDEDAEALATLLEALSSHDPSEEDESEEEEEV